MHVREHSVRLLKEKGSERLHGTIDIIPSHLQLFTAAELSSPSHHIPLFAPHTAVHTTCSHHVSLFTPRVRTTYRCSHHVFTPRVAVHTTCRCSHHVFAPRVAVHTTCSHSRSKYPNEKMLRWRNIFTVEQYSSNSHFQTTSAVRPKIFPLRKRLITVCPYFTYGTYSS